MTLLHNLLLPLLILVSWFYGLAIWVRNCFFNLGLLKSISFDTPIISIGNITAGGTGKTPLVISIAKLLKQNGYQPGIVSRGYGRSSQGLIMVHDGKSLLADVDMAGDEPYLMGKELHSIPIIVSENRVAGIQALLDNSPVDIVILDDAFQHRKVKRTIDIVMVSSYDKPGDYHLIPWGKLREPISSLKRAHCVIYSKTIKFQYPPHHNRLNSYMKYSPTCSIMKLVLMQIDDNGYHKALPTDIPIFAFCGIGDPNYFIQTVKESGLNIVGKRLFQDHQKYNLKVLENLSFQIQSSNCEAVITTEKDMVKIPKSFMRKFIFYVIKIDIFFENDSILKDIIKPVFPHST